MKHLFHINWNYRAMLMPVFLFYFLCAPSTFAQVSEGGVPYSFKNTMTTPVAELRMQGVDVPRLLAEDKLEEGKGIPSRFGYPHYVDYSMKNSGTWETLPNGDRIWRLRIVCPEAITINLLYKEYLLPEGAKFYIYNDSHKEVIGAFTARNNKADGAFATSLVRGEACTLEYYQPANAAFEGIINLNMIVHGYKDILRSKIPGEDYGGSGACNINVNCPVGADWQNEKRSVGLLISGGIRNCTGAMVNNVRMDLTQYYLTANHCYDANVNTWVIMFKYESPGCTNQDGPLNYTVSGTTLKARNAASDFCLVQLTEAIPDSYQVHFSGWNATDVPALTGASIHHPDGDIKKISFVSVPFEHDTWSSTPPNSHWRTRWSSGVTEPGSSGSPIYDQNHRIMGQLHGGPSSCTATDKSDLYGKTSVSWTYGTTPATRLKDWLDPDNTGTLVLDGWDPSMGTRDSIAPTTIADLHTTMKGSNSLTLAWTAPMDTSFSGVVKYNIRYATTPITDTVTFAAAMPLSYPGKPKPAGSAEVLRVDSLAPNTVYYFAIRSSDMWNNWSLLSNVLKDTTWKAPVVSVTPDSLKKVLTPNSIVVDSLLITNASTSPSTLHYTVEVANNTFPGEVNLNLIPMLKVGENYSAEKTDGPEYNFGQAIEGFGGPDSAGYKWIDSDEPNGPQYVWNDIAATGTLVTSWTATGTFDPKDEGYAGPFTFGFPFKFYRQAKTQVYVSSNGALIFNVPTANMFTNAAIPTAAAPNEYISAFWDDLDGRTQGTVHYKAEGDKFIIQFTNWQKYSATGSLTFQYVLYPSGKIMFYYNNMNATLNSATVGIENGTGTTGLQIAYNATYVKNNLAVKLSAEPDWLATGNQGGVLNQGASAKVQLTFRSEDFPEGNYSMDVKIKSNDPAMPVKTIPIRMMIHNPLMPITVTAPNGGEQWGAGTVKNITWNATDVANVAIKYSTDNGVSWLAVAASVPGAAGTYAWTVPNTPSTQCKVRVSNAVADSIFDVSNGSFAITAGQITWSTVVNVKDNSNLLNQNITFGASPVGTNGIDLALGEESLPPAPPAGTFDARFELPVTPADFSWKDYRKDTISSATWVIRFQPGASGYPFTFTWNQAQLPNGNFMLKDLVTGTLVNVDMKSQSSYTLTNTGVTALKIEYTKQMVVPMAMNTGWNMVSVPVTANDMTGTVLLPGANSQIFGYNNGYVGQTMLENGKGYWVRYASATNFNISGNPVAATTVPLVAGWNMVGPYHNNIATSAITTTPAGIINSFFFSFGAGYVQATNLEKGKGYWVRTSAAGVMNLPAGLTAKDGGTTVISADKEWGRIAITDAAGNATTLYALTDAQAKSANTELFSLPPVPPSGVFDVRFVSQKSAEVIGATAQTISISSAQYPVRIGANGVEVRMVDAATNGKLLNATLRNGESAVLENSSIAAVVLSVVAKPVSFELSQNYPNPFNPSTTIKYGLPEKTNISIAIFNQLGEKVATLFEGEKEAGYHSVVWNAANMGSGVYFYQIKSDKFTSIKKLILMK